MTTITRQHIEAATKTLAKAQLFDQRVTTDEPTIVAWAEVLAPHDLSLNDLLPAVVLHYSTSTSRIMPADVLRIARERRRDDQARAVAAVSPDKQPASVQSRKLAIAAACAQIGRAHDPERGETFETAPAPEPVESPATIAAKVARIRAAGPPQPMPGDDAQAVQ